jgi:hypothetical protein
MTGPCSPSTANPDDAPPIRRKALINHSQAINSPTEYKQRLLLWWTDLAWSAAGVLNAVGLDQPGADRRLLM